MKYRFSLFVGIVLGLWSGNAAALKPPADPPPVSTFFVTAETFAGWAYRSAGDQSFNEFEMDRAEFGVGFDQEGLGGFYADMEFVRSAGADSLIGIDGNSLVARAKYGFAYLDPEFGPGGRLVATFGLVPEPWIGAMEGGFDIRGARPLATERTGMFDTSDLGATLSYSIWDETLELTVAFLNGEGRRETERNTGKNTTAILAVRPWRPVLFGDEAVLGVFGLFRDGSLGVGSSKNHRYGGGLTFSHPRINAGSEFMMADGSQFRSDVSSSVLSVWASGTVIKQRLGLYGFYDRFDQDSDLDDGVQQTLGGGAFTDLIATPGRLGWRELEDAGQPPLQRLRVYVGYLGDLYGANAGGVPGAGEASEVHTIEIKIEARGLATLISN